MRIVPFVEFWMSLWYWYMIQNSNNTVLVGDLMCVCSYKLNGDILQQIWVVQSVGSVLPVTEHINARLLLLQGQMHVVPKCNRTHMHSYTHFKQETLQNKKEWCGLQFWLYVDACLTSSVNLSITTANKKELRVDPWCIPTPTRNPSVTPTAQLTAVTLLSHLCCTTLTYFSVTPDLLMQH